MKVNLSKLKADDKVKFRDGGEAVVEFIDVKPNDSYCYGLTYKDARMAVSFADSERYQSCGSLHGTAVKHPHDIIEIIPAPFNWDDVKWGQAFIWRGNIVYYLAQSLDDLESAVFRMNEESNTIYDGMLKLNCTRAPEHDMEV